MAADLKDCRLYGIVDLSYITAAEAPRIARAMIEGGIDLIQLRGKGHSVEELASLATELHAITSPHATPLIINDHAEIARMVEVEGESRRSRGRRLHWLWPPSLHADETKLRRDRFVGNRSSPLRGEFTHLLHRWHQVG